MQEYTNFLGDKVVGNVIILGDVKTPSGLEMVKVVFEDGNFEIMPKKRFEMIVTDEVGDLTAIRNKIRTQIGSTMFSLLHEYGIKVGEVDSVLDEIAQLVNNGVTKALNQVLGVEDKLDITLININEILLKNAKPTETNDAATSNGDAVDSSDQE